MTDATFDLAVHEEETAAEGTVSWPVRAAYGAIAAIVLAALYAGIVVVPARRDCERIAQLAGGRAEPAGFAVLLPQRVDECPVYLPEFRQVVDGRKLRMRKESVEW